MLRPHDPIPGRTLRAVAELTSAISKHADLESLLITGLSIDSHQIEAGDLFVAVAGSKVHGATYAGNAKLNGAVAVLTDEVGARIITDLPVLMVADPRAAAGVVAAWLHKEPMRDMFSVGVTGTNGKTTVTSLLYQIAMAASRQSGLVGTVETRIGDEVIPALRTTPEAPELQSLVAVMRERHMRNLFMEVSSHAISLNRIGGSHFDIAAFTNLSQDHLDFHADMDSYFAAKQMKYHQLTFAIDQTWISLVSKKFSQLVLKTRDVGAYLRFACVCNEFNISYEMRGNFRKAGAEHIKRLQIRHTSDDKEYDEFHIVSLMFQKTFRLELNYPNFEKELPFLKKVCEFEIRVPEAFKLVNKKQTNPTVMSVELFETYLDNQDYFVQKRNWITRAYLRDLKLLPAGAGPPPSSEEQQRRKEEQKRFKKYLATI
jgi:hypothetical protein